MSDKLVLILCDDKSAVVYSELLDAEMAGAAQYLADLLLQRDDLRAKAVSCMIEPPDPEELKNLGLVEAAA